MRRTDVNYYREERKRLTDRLADVQRETQEARTRLVELEREHSLLDELIGSLDAHVPEQEPDITPQLQERRKDVIGAG